MTAPKQPPIPIITVSHELWDPILAVSRGKCHDVQGEVLRRLERLGLVEQAGNNPGRYLLTTVGGLALQHYGPKPTTLRDGTLGVVISTHARKVLTLATQNCQTRAIAVWAETVGIDLKTPVEVWWCSETVDHGPKFATHQCASRDEAIAALHAMCGAVPPEKVVITGELKQERSDPPASPAPRGLFDLLAEMKATVERGDGKLKIVMPKPGWAFQAKEPWPSFPAIRRLIAWAKEHSDDSPWVLDLTQAEWEVVRPELDALCRVKLFGPAAEYAIDGIRIVVRRESAPAPAEAPPLVHPFMDDDWTPADKVSRAIERAVFARQKKCDQGQWGTEDFDTSEARERMVEAIAGALEAGLKEQGVCLAPALASRSLGTIADEVEQIAAAASGLGIYEDHLLRKAAGYLRDVGAVTEHSQGGTKEQGDHGVPTTPRLPLTTLAEQLEDHACRRRGETPDVEHDVTRLRRAAELVRAVAHGKNVPIGGAVRDIIDAALQQVDGPAWVDPTPALGDTPGPYQGWEIATEVAAGSDVGRRYVRAALHAGVMAEDGRSRAMAAFAADDVFRIDALAIEAVDPITKERVFVPPSKAGPSPKDMTRDALLTEVGEHRKVLHTLRRIWGILGVQKGETLLTAAQRVQGERDRLRAAIESSGTAARRGALQSILDRVKDVLQVQEGSPLHEAGYAPTTPMQAGDLVKLAERVMRSWTREAQATTAICRAIGVEPDSLTSPEIIAAKVKALVKEVDSARLSFRAKTGEDIIDAIKRCREEDLWEIQAVRLKVGAKDGETMVAAISRWADARDAGVRNALHAKPSETTVEAASRLWNVALELCQRPVLTPTRLHEVLYFAAKCGFASRLVREVVDANEAFLGPAHVARLRGVLASDPVDDLAYDTVLIGKTRDGNRGIWHEVLVADGQWRDQLWRQSKGHAPHAVGKAVAKASLSSLLAWLGEDGVESTSIDEALPHLVVMDAVRRAGLTIGSLGTYDARVEESAR